MLLHRESDPMCSLDAVETKLVGGDQAFGLGRKFTALQGMT